MVNFFSGFIVPESARRMANMFEARRELRAKYPDDEEYEKALAQWRRENPIEPGTHPHVVDHIDHIVKVAGIDHVGLGSDLRRHHDHARAAGGRLLLSLHHAGAAEPRLQAGGHPQDPGRNVLRVLRGAEEAAQSYK